MQLPNVLRLGTKRAADRIELDLTHGKRLTFDLMQKVIRPYDAHMYGLFQKFRREQHTRGSIY